MSSRVSQTGIRVLRVLEAIADNQPAGARALARLLEEDKSAVQRAIMALAEDGWIVRSVTSPGRWEVGQKIMAVADKSYGGHDLKRRAHGLLESLRDACGETAALIIPEFGRFVIVDVVESMEMLRVVPPVGTAISLRKSAAGRAILAHIPIDRCREFLEKEPDAALLRIYAQTRSQGFAISERETDLGANALAAPVFDGQGIPCGAVSIIGPFDRMGRDHFASLAEYLVKVTQQLSRGEAR
ncbi:MAG TPA: IclR family transcriptional regulator [Sphingobium sp.]|uniref:IclR family transcriptional regulator n=1 Tax=Sphingobium sp. TaxID=1912891 RepID=UPI002ED42054